MDGIPPKGPRYERPAPTNVSLPDYVMKVPDGTCWVMQ